VTLPSRTYALKARDNSLSSARLKIRNSLANCKRPTRFSKIWTAKDQLPVTLGTTPGDPFHSRPQTVFGDKRPNSVASAGRTYRQMSNCQILEVGCLSVPMRFRHRTSIGTLAPSSSRTSVASP